MYALTIKQPWAWAIAAGFKSIENRGWITKYRGPLLIHAGSSRDSVPAVRPFFERLGIDAPAITEHTYGAVIAIATLTDIRPVSDFRGDPWADAGGFCWVLDDVIPFAEPIVCPGALSLWTPKPPAMALVRGRLAGTRYAAAQ